MPVYNGGDYLIAAIESILCQTFPNFEFLIIDDGSTDNKSAEIIRSYTDSRIKIVRNKKNIGLAASLNEGIELSQGEYIVRMDQDDISLPHRFTEQLAFMEKHPEIALCGSWAKVIGKNEGFIIKYPTDPEEVMAGLLFRSVLVHPSVMIRRDILKRNGLRYVANELRKEDYSEDYGLWIELSERAKISNIPKILFQYRIGETNTSHTNASRQKEGSLLLKIKQLRKLGIEPTEEEMFLHDSIRPKEKETATVFIKKEDRWLRKIIDANAVKKIYDDTALAKIIYLRWKTICGNNTKNGLAVWKQFVRSPIFQMKPYQLLDGIKIFIKCLIGK